MKVRFGVLTLPCFAVVVVVCIYSALQTDGAVMALCSKMACHVARAAQELQLPDRSFSRGISPPTTSYWFCTSGPSRRHARQSLWLLVVSTRVRSSTTFTVWFTVTSTKMTRRLEALALLWRLTNRTLASASTTVAIEWKVSGLLVASNEHERKCFPITVENRTAITLEAIIREHVLPGSIVHTDCWRAYSRIPQIVSGSQHRTVNHSREYITVDTNTIEGNCRSILCIDRKQDWFWLTAFLSFFRHLGRREVQHCCSPSQSQDDALDVGGLYLATQAPRWHLGWYHEVYEGSGV